MLLAAAARHGGDFDAAQLKRIQVCAAGPGDSCIWRAVPPRAVECRAAWLQETLSLHAASLAAQGTHLLQAPTVPPQPSAAQHAREEKLVVLLGALLRRYVEGDVEGFKVRGHGGAGVS